MRLTFAAHKSSLIPSYFAGLVAMRMDVGMSSNALDEIGDQDIQVIMILFYLPAKRTTLQPIFGWWPALQYRVPF